MISASKVLLVVDIDGTVADNTHREHYVENGQSDWDNFLRPELVALDKAIQPAVVALQRLYAAGIPIAFLTGRDWTTLGDITREWLRTNVPGVGFRLFMRSPKDRGTPASQFKRPILEKLRREQGQFIIGIDNDPYLWPIYAKYGLSLRAPECWPHLMPMVSDLAPETGWRK